ncbi:solute carrier family 2, facilitated glucose transporter member 1-like isoform X1 [Patella vulgata]|uniref:solute carrier family 2, facilitated glucose transporter member 1-like isoform X1 n=2 Tax=Patella vulgata TaxID=6465 RepID=UPI0024A8FDB6|nr:solute carrier family 2, facilitated glucose transporter member 1-like isoform X1 [Patella vulgata]
MADVTEKEPLLGDSKTPQVKPKFTKHLILSIVACTLGSSFQFGYNTGVVNSPEKVMKSFYNESYHRKEGKYIEDSLLTLLWALTVAMYAVGGMIGGVSAGYWSNKYGRRGALLRNNVIAVMAAGLLGFSKMADSYEMLIAGRFVVGINAGINTGIVPLYLSEIAPIELRGFCGTFNQMSITFGVVISQLLGLDFILGTDELWPLLLALTLVPVLYQLCVLTFCCESPRYLMLTKHDEQAARKALMWFRETTNVNSEMDEMRSEAVEQIHRKKFSVGDLIKTKELRTPLIISMVLQLSQQFSGINAVIYYSTDIFTSAGLARSTAEYATLGVSVVNVSMTFVSAFFMDRLGRRALHLAGLGGMFVFTAVLTVSRVFQPSHHWLSFICILAVVFYIIFFAIGPGSIPWFIVAELFTQGPRTAAVSVAVLVNWLSNFVVGFVFPILQSAISDYSFVPFVVLLACFWLFTYIMLPETKGKTVEEIAALFLPKSLQESLTVDGVESERAIIN